MGNFHTFTLIILFQKKISWDLLYFQEVLRFPFHMPKKIYAESVKLEVLYKVHNTVNYVKIFEESLSGK